MTYAAESYAQKTMISLEMRNETVGTVLGKAEKRIGGLISSSTINT